MRSCETSTHSLTPSSVPTAASTASGPSRTVGILRPLAQLELEHLAARVERQRVDDVDGARHFEVRHVFARPGNHLGGVRLLARPRNDERGAHLAEALVGNTDNRNLRDLRV